MSQNVIGFNYTLRNKAGDVLDQSQAGQPLEYLEESGTLIPGLEQALPKLSVGDQEDIVVRPENGYGFRDETQIDVVSKGRLPVDEVKVGDMFQAGGDQHAPVVRVVAVEGDDVTLDANHPLAGQDLFFSVEIVSKREATAEEVAHGHAHQSGGCCGGGGEGGGCGCSH